MDEKDQEEQQRVEDLKKEHDGLMDSLPERPEDAAPTSKDSGLGIVDTIRGVIDSAKDAIGEQDTLIKAWEGFKKAAKAPFKAKELYTGQRRANVSKERKDELKARKKKYKQNEAEKSRQRKARVGKSIPEPRVADHQQADPNVPFVEKDPPHSMREAATSELIEEPERPADGGKSDAADAPEPDPRATRRRQKKAEAMAKVQEREGQKSLERKQRLGKIPTPNLDDASPQDGFSDQQPDAIRQGAQLVGAVANYNRNLTLLLSQMTANMLEMSSKLEEIRGRFDRLR